jgi:hypothetical protein
VHRGDEAGEVGGPLGLMNREPSGCAGGAWGPARKSPIRRSPPSHTERPDERLVTVPPQGVYSRAGSAWGGQETAHPSRPLIRMEPATVWVQRAVSVSGSLFVAQGFGHADPPNLEPTTQTRSERIAGHRGRDSHVSVIPCNLSHKLTRRALTTTGRRGWSASRSPSTPHPPVGSGPGTLTRTAP